MQKPNLRKNRLHNRWAHIALASTDLILFNGAPLIAALLVYFMAGTLQGYIPAAEVTSRLTSHFILSLLCVGWFWSRLRHYSYRKPFWFELKEILRTVLIFAVVDLAIVAFSKWHLSRYVWVFTWGSILVLLPLGRIITKKALDKMGLWRKQSVIIGTGPNAKEAYAALCSEKHLGFDIQYFFSAQRDHSEHILGVPVISDEGTLWTETDPNNTQFFIALEYEQEQEREQWIKEFAVRLCRVVSVIPTMRGIPLNSTDMSFIFSHEVLILRINNNLTKRSARIIKRTVDIIASVTIMLVLSPLLLTLMLLISKDGGSPIYGHTRIGRKGKKFECFKFRSMIKNSQEVLDQLLNNDPKARVEWNADFKLKNDPRVTKLGHFIRKTSLDELPQLWNVLKGEMSLVGPRPVVEAELCRYGEHVDYYLMAKPGMTGLWQVSGRNDVNYDTRVYFDAWYVKNWSLWNDIAILFKTVRVVLKRDGAY